jgi:hypothetical protein
MTEKRAETAAPHLREAPEQRQQVEHEEPPPLGWVLAGAGHGTVGTPGLPGGAGPGSAGPTHGVHTLYRDLISNFGGSGGGGGTQVRFCRGRFSLRRLRIQRDQGRGGLGHSPLYTQTLTVKSRLLLRVRFCEN